MTIDEQLSEEQTKTFHFSQIFSSVIFHVVHQAFDGHISRNFGFYYCPMRFHVVLVVLHPVNDFRGLQTTPYIDVSLPPFSQKTEVVLYCL
jgi:hypothetical protein